MRDDRDKPLVFGDGSIRLFLETDQVRIARSPRFLRATHRFSHAMGALLDFKRAFVRPSDGFPGRVKCRAPLHGRLDVVLHMELRRHGRAGRSLLYLFARR